MKVPFSWLSEYVDISGITPKEYDAKMTMSGSKVEEVVYLGQGIANVVTGKILQVEPHPDSDHLMICQLAVGQDEPVQIVTGAPNITPDTVGQICPVALHNSTLPGGVKITKGKLRGVVSNGMMCSFQELGIEHGVVPYACENGILLLPDNTEIGVDIKKVLGLDEYVADFEITSNRPDCLSIIGLARETAATFERPLKLPVAQVKGGAGTIDSLLSVRVQEPALCPRYTAKVVKNIKIEPSPAWMRQRLSAAGIRPINNIVDITNYVMLEYGQPMHAFDYACLSDGQIIVRRPQEGESLETLDGQQRAITSEMLAICDGQRPVAVAGVMGGANSEITDTTNTVVFESACFHGVTVRLTAKALGMRTEASGRFEKGLPPHGTMEAVLRACQLVEELGAGEVVDGVIDVDSSSKEPQRIAFTPDKINALLGTDLSAAQQQQYLERLGFAVQEDQVIVPFFRIDIARMCDVAEEVARMYGYDKIPTTLFVGGTVQGGLTPKQMFQRQADALCRAAGFDEAMTHSFISPKMYDAVAIPADGIERASITISNPLGEDFSIMRTTSLPSMLNALAHNYAHRNSTAALYEMAMIYTPQLADGKVNTQVLPTEERILTLGAYGGMDFFAVKGVIEALCHTLCVPAIRFEAEKNNCAYHPGRCAKIYAGQTEIGIFGTIHPSVCKSYGLSGEVIAAQLQMDALFTAANPVKRYAPLPKFPASSRDIAVVVADHIPAAQLENAISSAVGQILEQVTLFDVYKGTNIPDGKKSIAYSMSLRAPDHTLTDEECDAAMKRAIHALTEQFDAVLRG